MLQRSVGPAGIGADRLRYLAYQKIVVEVREYDRAASAKPRTSA